jgi:hypothetical protein
VEHIAEEHGDELRRLCLVCAEAVEDCGEGRASMSPSVLLSTEAREDTRKPTVEVKIHGMQA